MKRSLLLDNVKWIMILLVVLGHMIEPFIQGEVLLRALFKTIYSFHMPVFVFVAGVFSKQYNGKGYLWKILRSIVIPFVVFSFLFELPEVIINGIPSHYTTNFAPYWVLWFLFCLFFWRLLSPFFVKVKYPFLLAIMITLFMGYVDSIGYFLSISRMFYFFPFFLIGFQLNVDDLPLSLFAKVPKVIPMLFLTAVFILFYVFDDINYRWLFGSFSYSALGVAYWYGGIIRFCFLFLSFMSSIAVIFLIPNRRVFYTVYGEKSLYIYLWHGIIIKLFTALGLFFVLSDVLSGLSLLFVVILISCVVTAVCSLDVVSRFTNRFLFTPFNRFLLINKFLK
jgi:fucose 4-O-acetylase-like acetyltransferase